MANPLEQHEGREELKDYGEGWLFLITAWSLYKKKKKTMTRSKQMNKNSSAPHSQNNFMQLSDFVLWTYISLKEIHSGEGA